MLEHHEVKLDNFIGQERIKNLIKVSIKAALKQNKSVDHILLYAPPGLGKTTLAKIIASEMSTNFVSISAPTITKPADIISILNTLNECDVLFIDEIQCLPKNIEEILYTAMDEFLLRFIYENSENSKPVEIDLPHFTLIAATTKLSALSLAFRSRFSIQLTFEKYSLSDIEKIINNMALNSGYSVDLDALGLIANNTRNNPRNAINLVKRTIDHACVKSTQKITFKDAYDTLKNLNIFSGGLTSIDIKILEALLVRFKGLPTSLEAISNVINENLTDIQIVYEPFLVEQGYINRTKRGRQITQIGINYLEKENK
jgi:Holliday junction DNA helicase RuvB